MDVGALLQGLLLPLVAPQVTPVAPPAPAATQEPGVVAETGFDDGAAGVANGMSLRGAWIARAAEDARGMDLAMRASVDEDTAAMVAGRDGKSARSAEAGGALPQAAQQPEVAANPHPAQWHAPEMREAERVRMTVATPVSSPGWHEDLAAKVSLMVSKDAKSAELILTPPSLGRVEIQLTVSGDQTSAAFVAASPAARDALEQALPRLREFLADAGINLAQASVGGDSPSGRNHDGGDSPARRGTAGGTVAGTEPPGVAHAMRRIDGVVDTFA